MTHDEINNLAQDIFLTKHTLAMKPYKGNSQALGSVWEACMAEALAISFDGISETNTAFSDCFQQMLYNSGESGENC